MNSLIEDICSVAVTPDGRSVISGAEDGSIKVFELHTKQEMHHFPNFHYRNSLLRVIIKTDRLHYFTGSEC